MGWCFPGNPNSGKGAIRQISFSFDKNSKLWILFIRDSHPPTLVTLVLGVLIEREGPGFRGGLEGELAEAAEGTEGQDFEKEPEIRMESKV